eukprot:TRINITY_DN5510_c0_g1_i1.p1 TRINITY_DN5510_c0_g1~~TRINITY_DN5510_c0_g1_i1.p1  ORF type:complete len:348 (-),score=102.07 TRINITY_DN5510_c0_g1_i1:195-1199(-)
MSQEEDGGNKEQNVLKSLFGDDDSDDYGEDEPKNTSTEEVSHSSSLRESTQSSVIERTTLDTQVAEDDIFNDPNVEKIELESMPYERPPENSELCYCKVAGLEFQPKPFDPETFDEAPVGDKNSKRKGVPTVRWRYSLDPNSNNLIKESNTRLVKWSDGSMHLFVGNDIYDVVLQPFKGDEHHLFIRQRKDQQKDSFLECHGLMTRKMLVTPKNFSSIPKKQNIASDKKRKRKTLVGKLNDPEKEKEAKEKTEEKMIELRNQYGRHMQSSRMRGLDSDFLQQGADEYDEEQERQAENRILAAKRGDDELMNLGLFTDDEMEEDEEQSPSKKKRK